MKIHLAQTRPRRILIYGQLPPPFHGTNIMTQTFLRALKELGYQAKISSKRFSRRIEEVNKIKPAKAGRYFRYFWRFLSDVRQGDADLIVYFLSSQPAGLVAELPFVLFSQIFRIPYVLYLHTRGYGRLYSRSLLFRVIIKRVFHPASACFVLGERLKQEIQFFFLKKIFILPNCIEEHDLPLRISVSEMTRVLYLSNISESKGILTLMESIPRVIQASPNMQFVIAGPWQDPAAKKAVFEFINGQGIQSFVKFLGPLYGKDKDKLLSSSDIFVFPSHYPLEAMSLVVLEAMRAGLPVVTSDIGALPEVVLDGKTGFVIPPHDPESLAEKILRLAQEPRLRGQMGQESRKRFHDHFSFAVYKKRVGLILKDMASSPVHGRP